MYCNFHKYIRILYKRANICFNVGQLPNFKNLKYLTEPLLRLFSLKLIYFLLQDWIGPFSFIMHVLMCECANDGASGFSLSFMIPLTLGVNLVDVKQATTRH